VGLAREAVGAKLAGTVEEAVMAAMRLKRLSIVGGVRETAGAVVLVVVVAQAVKGVQAVLAVRLPS